MLKPKVDAGPHIVFRIKPDGTVESTIKGIEGSSCSGLGSKIEERLGEIVEDRETEEYYQSDCERENA